MKIYTGYFAAIKKYDYPCPISIAGKTPDWFTGPKATFLAPKADWFWTWKPIFDKFKKEGRSRWAITPIEVIQNDPIGWYICKYTETVLTEAPEIFYQRLEKLSDGKDCTLICYEKPDDGTPETFCHRNLVANFLKSGGFDVVGEYLGT
jgi:hypothetical protein